MRLYHRLWILTLFILCWFSVVRNLEAAQLSPLFAPGRGVLDASLVVIVKPEIKDIYRTLETYLDDPQAGELLYLPDLKLHILPNDKPRVSVEITPDTRLLLFLKHKTLDPTAWEVTFYGADCYAVESPEKVEELRTMAEEAIAVRREWDAALSIIDARQRVEALWKLFLKKDIRVLRQTRFC